jgi:hypothetical protein
MDLDGILMIGHSAGFKYLRKNGSKIQPCIDYLYPSRKYMIMLGGKFCITFLLSLV